jgi:hypothetical protein
MRDATAEAVGRAVLVRVHVIGAAVLTPAEAEAFAAEVLAAAGEARAFREAKDPRRVAIAKRTNAKRAEKKRKAKATTEGGTC